MRPKPEKMDLNNPWFYNCLTCCLHIRVVSELIVVLFFTVLFILLVSKCEQAYTCIMLQPIRRMIIGQTLNDGGCPTLTQTFSYSSYIFCGNTDRDSVYEHLVHVVPLKKENITTGFFLEECLINNSGKSIFDIQSELLQQCEHLVFYVTSSYLNEEKLCDIQLETVLYCIKLDLISMSNVLIIIAYNCELPDKIRYNLPEAAANIHDWVTVTKSSKRISQVLKWFKKKMDIQISETLVLTFYP